MNWLRKGIENQSVGLLPILLFMVLDNFFAYQLSFLIAIAFCLLSLVIYYLLRRSRVYLYLLLPATASLVLFSFFMSLYFYPVLFVYSPLVIEVLLVSVLSAVGIYRKRIYQYLRDLDISAADKVERRGWLDELFFMVPIIRRVFTIHLLSVIFYGIVPESMQSLVFERFLLRFCPIVLGVGIIFYEQIRLLMLHQQLNKETWLPVLSDDGRVVGRIAGSVSKSVAKKFYHPVVRVIVVYKGMLYLGKRASDAYVSPGKWDTPFYNHIQFKQTIEDAARNVVASLGQIASAPRFLIRYKHESGKVKHLVSLFAICLRDDQIKAMDIQKAKFWTASQIDENFKTGIFSEYFTEEYAYLRNTVMLSECLSKENV